MPGLVATAHAATLSVNMTRTGSRPAAGGSGASGGSWAIQVGTFSTERAARDAAASARRTADGDVRIDTTRQRGKTLWRAQITGLTGTEAQGACASLARQRVACAVIRSEPRQVASR
jgi:hypothetical protein